MKKLETSTEKAVEREEKLKEKIFSIQNKVETRGVEIGVEYCLLFHFKKLKGFNQE